MKNLNIWQYRPKTQPFHLNPHRPPTPQKVEDSHVFRGAKIIVAIMPIYFRDIFLVFFYHFLKINVTKFLFFAGNCNYGPCQIQH